MTRLDMAILVLLSAVFALTSCTVAQAGDYPWVHYFKPPDMRQVHCAFADAEGNVIAATGDWNYSTYNWGTGDTTYWYLSDGIFQIREGDIEAVQCPASTFVLDCATDSAGRTWVLFAEGHDYRQHVWDPWRSAALRGPCAASDVGYRHFRWPTGMWSYLTDYRLATIEEGGLREQRELLDRVPAEPVVMAADPQGRIYVMSCEDCDDRIADFFISWWSGHDSSCIRTICLWDLIPDSWAADYPKFGPDDLVYFLIRIAAGDANSRFAVLCLDPETEEYEIWRASDYAFLDSEVYCFYVDQFNVKWFGTDDGLVRFDGETWMRFASENSPLPYDRIKQIQYDEIDYVYYIVSAAEDWREHPDDYVALSVFSPTGRAIYEPSYMPGGPLLRRGSGNIWYLMPGWDDDLVYVYDHVRLSEFSLRDWVDVPEYSAWDFAISPTTLGQTFFANDYCVMIW